MTVPDVHAHLETARDELEMARESLTAALVHAHVSPLHSTYTAAIKHILANNRRSIDSMRSLLRTLEQVPTTPKP